MTKTIIKSIWKYWSFYRHGIGCPYTVDFGLGPASVGPF